MKNKPNTTAIGLDLNATRARALAGVAGSTPRVLALDGDHADLPLFLGLERRQIEIGHAARSLCRRLPHLICWNFLPLLCTPYVWKTTRHALDGSQASALILKHLAASFPAAQALGLAVPGYLSRSQVVELNRAAEQAQLLVTCSVIAPLAAALAAYQQATCGSALVLDADDHALTLTLTVVDEGRMHVLDRETCPQLGLRAWRERLLDTVADRCIRRSRRDPRDSSEAEQALWEQLDGIFAATARGRLADVSVQAGQWYQDLVLRPEEVVAFTARLATQTRDAVRHFLHRETRPAPATLVLTAAIGRLPGLAAALQELIEQPAAAEAHADPSDDFGENLLQTPAGETTLTVLEEDALARTAWELATSSQRGHFDTSAPLLAISRSPHQARRYGTIA